MTAGPSPAARALQFVLDGELVRIEQPEATQTLLQYLREVAGRTGTKEGCAEGDCGACTVVLGEAGADRIHYRAINSCIRFLPTIDGCELVTVESLSRPDEPPHPVQQALVDLHGSQCGFCTPGFVMSLFGLYLEQPEPDRAAVLAALDGNLCRCTGYRPIIDAGLAMAAYPEPLRWSRADAQSPARRSRLRSLAVEAPLQLARYSAPQDIDTLAAQLNAQPDSLLLAGGTDIGLWVTQSLRELPPLIWIGEVPQLKRIEPRDGGLWIGAAVTLTDVWPALLEQYPELSEQAARFASTPIRNSATLCGNLANGSPIGDSLPAMLALDAVLHLRRGDAVRELPIDQFYLDYRLTALQRGEFLVGVWIPPRCATDIVASYKVSRRHDQDISAVSATFRLTLAGNRVTDARLAFGGMAGTARRASAAEQALLGAEWTLTAVHRAQLALATDFTPLSDLRASGQYRLDAAQALLERFFLGSQGGQVRLPDAPVATQELRS
jgi:xanthine dehydrogenase small subunit